jgi:hypothetical protein
MGIPTAQDQALAEIDDIANSIKVKLTIMRHAGKGARDFTGLRDVLQQYVNKVMAFARSTEA